MSSIYLSPSTQENNVGAGSYGTEEQRMNQIMDRIEADLQGRFTLYRNRPGMTLQQVVADSNAKKPDLHFALHSNAGGGSGAECWISAKGGQAEQFAKRLMEEMSALTPGKDRGVKVSTSLYEVNKTKAPAVILEVEFHDTPEGAAWIVFLPISLVMIGGWLIDRENTHDTMKNLITVPVSYPKLLGGKLAVTGLLSLLFGCYSVAVTVLTGVLAGLPGLTPGVILQQGGQVVAAALTTFLVCMPMILIFGQMRGADLGGSILTFFLGYCILFFKSGFLLSAYPFSAALVLAGFDMQEYNGATEAPSIPLALLGMAAVIVLTAVILTFSRPSSKAGSTKKKKSGGRRQAGRRTR